MNSFKYRRWYGIHGLEFIPHGEWNDAEIRIHACKEQKERRAYVKPNRVFNSVIVEDSMIDAYNDSEEKNTMTFEQFITCNVDMVWDYIALAFGAAW